VIFSLRAFGHQGTTRAITDFTPDRQASPKLAPTALKMRVQSGQRELALACGMRPIPEQSPHGNTRDFANALWQRFPLGSGPYAVSDYKAGKQVTLTRQPGTTGARDVPLSQRQPIYRPNKARTFIGDAGCAFFRSVPKPEEIFGPCASSTPKPGLTRVWTFPPYSAGGRG